MDRLEWTTEKMKVSQLRKYEKNPRKLSSSDRQRLLESVERFDLVEIPVIDKDGVVVAGNQRLEVIAQVYGGDREIDVRVPSRKLTEQELEEYNIISNKVSADWDLDKLIDIADKDFLFEVGFSRNELGLDSVEKDLSKQGREEIPEMELKGFEHYDYIVFVCKELHDFVYLCQEFNVGKVNDSYIFGKRKIGIGRVIDGKHLVEKLQNTDSK